MGIQLNTIEFNGARPWTPEYPDKVRSNGATRRRREEAPSQDCVAAGARGTRCRHRGNPRHSGEGEAVFLRMLCPPAPWYWLLNLGCGDWEAGEDDRRFFFGGWITYFWKWMFSYISLEVYLSFNFKYYKSTPYLKILEQILIAARVAYFVVWSIVLYFLHFYLYIVLGLS